MTSLKLLKEKAPLVICITNDVVKNFTANGLVALGASPAMSEYPEDLEDLLKYAGGLLINIGTLTDETWKLYQEALKIAEKYNVPAVLDPVACGAGAYRKKVSEDLIKNYKLAAIRGNAGEIASLVGINVASKGVDSAGVDNIDEIIDASYGIMIARGDLGIEVPIEQIPGIQRSIINKCILKKKPVIVATQMLHTMINNPRPTRAEVTDIANAIYSHTDALMLSGETASGKYPIEAVQTMARIAEAAEADAHQRGHINVPMTNLNDQREFLSRSAIEATEQLGVKGIVTDSETGLTARNLAAFRGPNPVLAICYKEKVQRWLNLSYGVIAIHQQQHKSSQEMFIAALRMLRQKGYIDLEDNIAYLSGSFGGGGTTFLEINKVGEVFNRSYRFHLPEEETFPVGKEEK